jgi:hypothetical protein
MNSTRVGRVLLGAAVAIAIAACAPAAGGASTSQTLQHVATTATQPAAIQPVATQPAATQPAATQPATAAQPVATCSPGASACPIRISFAPGAYSGQAEGRLTGINSEQWFVVNARAGQAMVVVVEGAGPTRGIVYFPDQHSIGQPGGRVFDEILPASGDYRIRVTESTMGEAWSGRVDVIVLIY